MCAFLSPPLLPLDSHSHALAHTCSVFLPAADIPRFVAHGNVDMGITGRDTILESRTQDVVTECLPLGFGGCKLQVQVPEKGPIQTVEQLCGKRVVTSYTALSRDYFRELDEKVGLLRRLDNGEEAGEGTHVEYVGGSVEAACALGLADGIGRVMSQPLSHVF